MFLEEGGGVPHHRSTRLVGLSSFPLFFLFKREMFGRVVLNHQRCVREDEWAIYPNIFFLEITFMTFPFFGGNFVLVRKIFSGDCALTCFRSTTVVLPQHRISFICQFRFGHRRVRLLYPPQSITILPQITSIVVPLELCTHT